MTHPTAPTATMNGGGSSNGLGSNGAPPRRSLSGTRLTISRNSSRSSFNGGLSHSNHGPSNPSGGCGCRASQSMNSINELVASADASLESSSEDQPTRGRNGNEGGLPPIRWIQNRLDWRGSDHMPQFCHARGLGRVATLALTLGAVLAVHALILVQIHLHGRGSITISILDGSHPMLTLERIQLVYQWALYAVALTAFHTLEFFTTAIYNPAVTSADSFVVNQSMAYTTAALVSWIEFWIRFAFFPFVNNVPVSKIGLILVTSGQIVRALAMITCGESFNHLIQQTKKDNHSLITHGM